MRNFNEFFRKNVAYDNKKSHKKPGLHRLFRRNISGKTTGGDQIDPSPRPHFPHHLPPAPVPLSPKPFQG